MDTALAIITAAELLQNAKNAVAFTGAGISTPSGIPDFRSPASGLWTNIDAMAVASLQGFRATPAAFYEWVKPVAQITLSALPNAAHHSLVQLERLGKLSTVITQNIDMLHQRAGQQTVYELHGHFREATCTHCFRTFDGISLLETFLATEQVPLCPYCGGVIKPNVILFGEQLPVHVLRRAQVAARTADVMLVVGSSLEVAPASDIPLLGVGNGAALVIINLEPTSLDRYASVTIHQDAAIILPEIVRCMEALP
jgi:NAD-dependent deacetylase